MDRGKASPFFHFWLNWPEVGSESEPENLYKSSQTISVLFVKMRYLEDWVKEFVKVLLKLRTWRVDWPWVVGIEILCWWQMAGCIDSKIGAK